MSITETASGDNSIAITGTATGSGSLAVLAVGDASGVRGQGSTWHGVIGLSQDGFGVYGESKGSGVVGKSTGWHGVGGFTDNPHAFGVYGESKGAGVVGNSIGWHGVAGFSAGTTGGAGVYGEHKSTGVGVLAKSSLGAAVWATSDGHEGVHAETRSAGTAAIAGYNLNPAGTGAAIYGEHKFNGIGVLGKSNTSIGVWATSSMHEAVHAETQSLGTAAIAAYNLNPSGTGAALYAKKVGSAGHAAFFDGNVFVTGDIGCLNADCAEDFDIEESNEVEPGSVVVIGEDGRLRECKAAYDKRVVGVISGAGSYKPAFVLDKQPTRANRKPVALVGKVFCKVDADFAAISVGDLLTTSATRGHAMKIGKPDEGFGAVIGKALRPLQSGRGLIPILVALQ